MTRYSIEESTLTNIADAIREKTDSADDILVSEMANKIKSIGNNDSTNSDYDWIISDGNTHIWISLAEGRTNPMLGLCLKGTVTVDWGDGSTPDTLVGTSISTVQWTPNHQYNNADDYMITLIVDGDIRFFGVDETNEYSYILRHASTADGRNRAYLNAVKKIELGQGKITIGDNAFLYCTGLTDIYIPNSITAIGECAFCDCNRLKNIRLHDNITSIEGGAFAYCYGLTDVIIPDSVVSFDSDSIFSGCYGLKHVTLPKNMTKIDGDAFYNCYNLTDIIIPDKVAGVLGVNAFHGCYNLTNITIPSGVITLGANSFNNCRNLTSITIPEGVVNIYGSAFSSCERLVSITIPSTVTKIVSNTFNACYGLAFYDFTNHVSIPELASIAALSGIPADCEIRVPAALVDEWKAATNWSRYADYIVGV